LVKGKLVKSRGENSHPQPLSKKRTSGVFWRGEYYTRRHPFSEIALFAILEKGPGVEDLFFD
jgi:hypothetical protein